MINALITYLQVFSIGFVFGIAGPCFLTCAPVLITYAVGKKKGFGRMLIDINIFLAGKSLAYVILGFLAGLSGAFLRDFTGTSLRISHLAGGILTIILGILVAFGKQEKCQPEKHPHNAYHISGLFLLGLVLGISPCGPLLALFFDIALMARNALDGALYALFFGLGTYLSGLIVVGAALGLISRFPLKLLNSDRSILTLRILSGILLVLLGAGLFLGVSPGNFPVGKA